MLRLGIKAGVEQCRKQEKQATLTLSKREAKELILEIADRCEAAYRRGAQQAVVLGLNAEDAAWYRYYGVKPLKNGSGFRYQHALRIPESGIDSKTGKAFTGQQYSKGGKYRLVRAIEAKGDVIRAVAQAGEIDLHGWGPEPRERRKPKPNIP